MIALIAICHWTPAQSQNTASLVERGIALVHEEKDLQAEEVLYQALTDAQRSEDHYEASRALLWLSECAFLRRDYEGTRRLNEAARQVADEFLHTDTISFYFTILQNLGVSNSYLGRLDLQRHYYKLALNFQQQHFPTDSGMRADALSNLSAAYYRTFMLDSALFWFDSTLTIATEEKMPRLRSIILLNKGKIHAYLHDYDRAIRHQQEALRLSNTTNDQILGLSHLSDYYQEAGKPEQALEHLQNARALVRQENKSDQQYYSLVELKACELYRALGDKEQFRQALQSLLVYLEPRGENFLADRAKALQLYAGDLLNQGQYRKARQQAELALQLIQQQEHPELIVNSYQLIAQASAAQGQYAQSLDWVQAGLRATTPGFDETAIHANPSVSAIQTLEFGLPLLEAKMHYHRLWYESDQNVQHLLVAESAQRTADSLLFESRQGMRSDVSRRILSEQLSPFQRESMLLYYRLYTAQQDDKWLAAAFHFSERSRSLLIAENLASRSALRSIIPAALQQKGQRLSERMQYLRVQLAQPENKAEYATWQQQLFELQQEWISLLADLEKHYPRYHKLKYELPFATIPDVREDILAPNEVLLSFTDLDDQVLCIGISQDTAIFELLTMPQALREAVPALRRELLNRRASYYQHGYQLYRAILDPISSLWEGKDLVLIPDGQLWYIPFNALPTSSSGDRAHQQNFLIETSDIRWLYASHRTFARRVSSNQSINWLGIAPFGEPLTQNGPDKIRLNHLPGSYEEVTQIAALFSDLKVATSTNAGANQRFFETQAPKAQVLHLSTHAKSNASEPLLSSIFFRHNTNSGNSVEALYAAELATMVIPAELVVLSACETQAGRLQGGEGIAGWAQSFAFAGAEGLMASSWSVNDATGSQLMWNFYNELKDGAGKAQSYGSAQRTYLQKADPLTLHPYYWAGFIYIGDNDELCWKEITDQKGKISPTSFLFILLLLGGLLLIAKILPLFKE